MTTKELIDYIESELKKGEQKDAIKARLLQNGWGNDDIEETFEKVSKQISISHNLNSSHKPKPRRKYLMIITLLLIVFYISVGFKYQGNINVKVVDEITRLPIENARVEYFYYMHCSGFESCAKTLRRTSYNTDKNGYVEIKRELIWDGLSLFNPTLGVNISKEDYHSEETRRGSYSNIMSYQRNKEVRSSFLNQELLIYLMPVLKDSVEPCKSLNSKAIKEYCLSLNTTNVLVTTKNSRLCYDLPVPYKSECLEEAVYNDYFKDSFMREEAYELLKKEHEELCKENEFQGDYYKNCIEDFNIEVKE